MIQSHELDFEKSKEVYENHSHCIAPKECYNNVFNLIYYYGSDFTSGEWKIAYGYYSVIGNLMARHCFVVTNENKVIDPTIFTQSNPKEDRQYISYKIFNGLDEYLDVLEKEDRQPALYKYLHKTEREIALPWAKENGFILIG